jgi:DNA primase large subunit
LRAFDFRPDIEEKEEPKKRNYELDDSALQEKLPESLFPPCVNCLLSGIKDGKKRGLFILVNFLTSVGWDYPDIEAFEGFISNLKWNNWVCFKLTENGRACGPTSSTVWNILDLGINVSTEDQ